MSSGHGASSPIRGIPSVGRAFSTTTLTLPRVSIASQANSALRQWWQTGASGNGSVRQDRHRCRDSSPAAMELQNGSFSG